MQLTAEQLQAFSEIRIAEYFPGWTLEYIRSLSLADIQAIFAVKAATHKYTEEENKKLARRKPGR